MAKNKLVIGKQYSTISGKQVRLIARPKTCSGGISMVVFQEQDKNMETFVCTEQEFSSLIELKT